MGNVIPLSHLACPSHTTRSRLSDVILWAKLGEHVLGNPKKRSQTSRFGRRFSIATAMGVENEAIWAGPTPENLKTKPRL
jgi:hypothetical protein